MCLQYPGPDGRSLFRDQDVARWLHTLADHLQAQQVRGGSGSDLDVHLLWPSRRTARTPLRRSRPSLHLQWP